MQITILIDKIICLTFLWNNPNGWWNMFWINNIGHIYEKWWYKTSFNILVSTFVMITNFYNKRVFLKKLMTISHIKIYKMRNYVSWQNKKSLILSPHHPPIIIQHPSTGRSALEELWDPALQAMDRGVSPTHASGNRHTDLSPRCGPCSDPWTGSSSSWTWLGVPGKHCFWLTPMDKRAFVEVQVSRGEVLVHNWRKKIYEFWCTGEGKKNSLISPISSFPQGSTVSGQETAFQSVISLAGKYESM